MIRLLQYLVLAFHDLDFSSPSSSLDTALADVHVPVCPEGRRL